MTPESAESLGRVDNRPTWQVGVARDSNDTGLSPSQPGSPEGLDIPRKGFLMTREIIRSEEGATGVEYGLIVALIAAAIVVVVALLGQNVLVGFTAVEAQLPDA